jgi:hypothetical protein
MRLSAAALLLLATPLFAAEPVDLAMQSRIRDEGFRRSQVMDLASELIDGIGPRLTGSPNAKRANYWARTKLEQLGLQNAHLESWGPFGRGWTYDSVSVRMTAPDVAQLVAIPAAWSPSTEGVVHGRAVKVKLESDADFEKQKGKLAGAIVLLGDMPEVKPQEKAAMERYDAKELADLADYATPGKPRLTREEYVQRRTLRRKRLEFFAAEKAAAVIEPGRGNGGGTFIVQQSGSWKATEPTGVPWVVMSTEQYGRLARLADKNTPVELDLDVKTRFLDDPTQYNTIAEIPGTDKNGEVVMVGAHLDSWHSGTGATDNAAGVVAAMEAVRIIQALGIAPRRTIRIALWTGEEQGLLGSHAYVAQHFGARPEPGDAAEKDLPSSLRKSTGLPVTKPEYGKISAYFNLDNGTGKIRGIYAQENAAVVPIFTAWLEPLRDLGATTVTMRNTGSTDHVSFDEIGIPGFQFIQDPIEYDTRTHHTDYDVFERLQRDDLMQASVVMASFLWDAANRPEPLPRKYVRP